MTETKVFVASDITPVNEPDTDEQPGFIGFEFQLVEYEKDEYIKMIDEKNKSLETQVDNTMIALCEMYETMM